MRPETLKLLNDGIEKMDAQAAEQLSILKNAERYCWLRDSGVAEVYLPTTKNASGWANLGGFSDVSARDCAVDAAMAVGAA